MDLIPEEAGDDDAEEEEDACRMNREKLRCRKSTAEKIHFLIKLRSALLPCTRGPYPGRTPWS